MVDSSFFKRGDPVTTWHLYDIGVFCCLFLPLANIWIGLAQTVWSVEQMERWHDSIERVDFKGAPGPHMVCIHSVGLWGFAQPVLSPLSTVPWGLAIQNIRKQRSPFHWTQSRVVFQPGFPWSWNADFTALMWVFLDKSQVTSYFTAGMQAVRLQKFFFCLQWPVLYQ